MGKHTPLYDAHRAAGARLVDFAGWELPLHYGSQIDEHHAVRRRAGMFDVSHMAVVDILGTGARAWLRRLLANDVAKADAPGKAVYSCMLNPSGGVKDDLIVYHLGVDHYRTVVNAATTAKDLAWMREQVGHGAVAIRHRDDLAIIAVQGPQARAIAGSVLPTGLAQAAAKLKAFQATADDDLLVGRTGYTGEDGYECILPGAAAQSLWQKLGDGGVTPCGLGARDTLRLEAGLNLYGQDMHEDSHPFESGLGWTVAWKPAEREFIGRQALSALREDHDRVLVGVLLEAKGIMRAGQTLHHPGAEGSGLLTSAGYAPTLERSIGLARVPRVWKNAGPRVDVDIRGQGRAARLVDYPFVRHGESRIAT